MSSCRVCVCSFKPTAAQSFVCVSSFHPECRRELAELLAEAKYFCIEPLAEACEKAMKNLKEPAETVVPIVRVPLITSPKEEQALIAANSTKPIVKLLINRHNNKYSYTGASDDNILKNIELFDKLSLRFSNRVGTFLAYVRRLFKNLTV